MVERVKVLSPYQIELEKLNDWIVSIEDETIEVMEALNPEGNIITLYDLRWYLHLNSGQPVSQWQVESVSFLHKIPDHNNKYSPIKYKVYLMKKD